MWEWFVLLPQKAVPFSFNCHTCIGIERATKIAGKIDVHRHWFMSAFERW